MFRKKYEFELSLDMMESTSDELLVVPDQSFTVREILSKFTSGVILPVNRVIHYDSDDGFDVDVDDHGVAFRSPDFDIVDADDIARDLRFAKEKKNLDPKPDPNLEPISEPNSEPNPESVNSE